MAWIKAYKGFNKNLQCQPDDDKPPFQYEVGKEYEENDAKLCSCGFHACEFPLDVFRYYPPADSRYCEVELDAIEEKEGDSKRTGKKIKIGAEIGLDGIIKAGVKFILEKTESCDKGTDDWSVATNTGYQSVATNTGDWSAATNTGYRSVATNTGDQSVATNTGDWSAATNTGNRSVATNTGDQSVATNTGYRSVAVVSGQESVACALGFEGRAKGAKGCWLVLAEWKDGHRTDVKCFFVDGYTIKENTYYVLQNGKPQEVN